MTLFGFFVCGLMGFFWGMVGERVPSALLWEAITKVVGCIPFGKGLPVCRCPNAFRGQRGRHGANSSRFDDSVWFF